MNVRRPELHAHARKASCLNFKPRCRLNNLMHCLMLRPKNAPLGRFAEGKTPREPRCARSPNQVLTHAARAAAATLWPRAVRAKGPGQGNCARQARQRLAIDASDIRLPLYRSSSHNRVLTRAHSVAASTAHEGLWSE